MGPPRSLPSRSPRFSRDFATLLEDAANGKLGEDVVYKAFRIFRQLTGGRIWVHVERRPGRKRTNVRGVFTPQILRTVKTAVEVHDATDGHLPEEVSVWLRKPPRLDAIAERVHQLMDIEDLSYRETAKVLQEEDPRINSGNVWYSYRRWYQMQGLPVPERSVQQRPPPQVALAWLVDFNLRTYAPSPDGAFSLRPARHTVMDLFKSRGRDCHHVYRRIPCPNTKRTNEPPRRRLAMIPRSPWSNSGKPLQKTLLCWSFASIDAGTLPRATRPTPLTRRHRGTSDGVKPLSGRAIGALMIYTPGFSGKIPTKIVRAPACSTAHIGWRYLSAMSKPMIGPKRKSPLLLLNFRKKRVIYT